MLRRTLTLDFKCGILLGVSSKYLYITGILLFKGVVQLLCSIIHELKMWSYFFSDKDLISVIRFFQ